MEEKLNSIKDKKKGSVMWVPPEEIKEVYKEPKVGDVLFTSSALPTGDVLYWNDFEKKEDCRISIGNLRDYLKLLELIILHERVIIGRFPGFKARFTTDEFESKEVQDVMEHYYGWYKVVPALSLGEDLSNRLKNTGIIMDAVAFDKRLSYPDKLVERYLKIDDRLKYKFEEYCKEMKEYHKIRGELAERVAFSLLSPEYGGPLYISEFCRLAGIPYWLSESEEKVLENQVNMENLISSNVIGILKEKLDSGAREQLEKLSKLGVSTVFPESPIASTIIQDANKPEDLNTIALQMREDFCKIRRCMNDMQQEMIKEETSIEEKIKIYREIESLCDELWTKKGEGWKTILNSISGFLNVAIEGSTIPNVRTMKGIVESLVNKPYELVIRAMKRRKLRVLLEAKKNFLRSNNWSDKIARIFGLTIEEVRQAQMRKK